MVHEDFKKYFSVWNLGVVISIVSFLEAIVIRFPQIFTTETIRFIYSFSQIEFIENIFILVSGIIGFIGLIKQSRRKLSVVILSLVFLSFGILNLPTSNVNFLNGKITIGLDWLLIDFVVTAIIFVPLEWLAPLKSNQSKFHEFWKTDLTYFIVFDLSIKFILFAIRFPAEYLFTNHFVLSIQHFIQNIPFVLQLLFALFIADLFQYARHFTSHKIPFLWRFHSIHHSPTKLDWLSGSRSHLFDLIFDRAVIFMPIYFLGFKESVFISYTAVVALQSVWAHTNSFVDLGWLKYVIVTPQYHRWHHAKEKVAHDKNFAVHFPVIDMIFGTYFSLKNGHPKSTGITENDFPDRGYLKQFIYPFKGNSKKD